MAKQITEERILKALERASGWRRGQIEADIAAQRPFLMLGIKAAFCEASGDELPQHEIKRAGLEMAYMGQPVTPEHLELVQDRLYKNIDRRNEFRDRVDALQERAGISGLIRGHYQLGEREFPCWVEHEDLVLVQSDLILLSAERQEIFANWVDYCVGCSLNFWANSVHNWVPCEISEIQAAVEDNAWVQVHESRSYYSPSVLASQGCDSWREAPTHDDDVLCQDVYLSAGSTTDTLSASGITSFCASRGKPAC